MSTASIKETLLHEVNILSPDYCPAVLDFIATLKTNRQPAVRDWDNEDVDDWDDDDWKVWLESNPPVPIEDDPFFTPEHVERLRQREKDMDEGKTKVITFTPEELEDFWQEMEHSPEEAKEKARKRAYYRTPKQS